MFEIFIKSPVCHGIGGDGPQIKETVDAWCAAETRRDEDVVFLLLTPFCMVAQPGELSPEKLQLTSGCSGLHTSVLKLMVRGNGGTKLTNHEH